MSTLQEIQSALPKLNREELHTLQDLIDEMMEDERELSDEFKTKLARADAQIAAGEYRVRHPGA